MIVARPKGMGSTPSDPDKKVGPTHAFLSLIIHSSEARAWGRNKILSTL